MSNHQCLVSLLRPANHEDAQLAHVNIMWTNQTPFYHSTISIRMQSMKSILEACKW